MLGFSFSSSAFGSRRFGEYPRKPHPLDGGGAVCTLVSLSFFCEVRCWPAECSVLDASHRAAFLKLGQFVCAAPKKCIERVCVCVYVSKSF